MILNGKVFFTVFYVETMKYLSFFFYISTPFHLFTARYTTLSYRAPEMINLYGGKPITTKADIWVRPRKVDIFSNQIEKKLISVDYSTSASQKAFPNK